MSLSHDEWAAAKVQELDRLIAELQKRRAELLGSREDLSRAPPTSKKEPDAKAPPRLERPPQPVVRTPTPQKEKKSALEAALDELPWKSFKKKEGEWAFLRDREGRLIDELQTETAFVDEVRKKGELVVGKYRYQVSEDKFLNRYFAGT